MNTFLMRIVLCCSVLLMTLTSSTEIANAASCASLNATESNCGVNQQMTQNGGGDGFGAAVQLRQTFIPSQTKGLCKVDLLIQKNNKKAGSLTLKIMGGDLASPLSQIIPASAVPLNVATWVNVYASICPTGPQLQTGLSYELVLSASDSPANAYTWINSQVPAGNAAYANGSGGRNPGTGWVQQNYDYAFQVSLCN